MRKILLSILTIALVVTATAGATRAQYSDTETSTGNTFTSGSLDLDVDGNNGTNTVKFTVTGMKPGSQPKGTYHLNNVGSIPGYLDIENISVTSNENSCVDPESDAGDSSCGNPGAGEGELQDVVNLRLFEDNDCDGWIGAGETVFYNGMTGSVAGNYERNKQINAGGFTCVTAIFDWGSTADDNKAMGDDMTLNLTFELAQTTGQ